MSNSLSGYQPTDSKPLHITLAVPRVLKSDGVDYTYYQSVCSCGWSGDYKASKLTAQEDKCQNNKGEGKMKINSAQIKLAKRVLIQLRNEYSQDISERYNNSLSDVVALLRDIEGDLKERDK